MLYLASKSPRRTELLSQIGAEHEVINIHVDEFLDAAKSSRDNVESLSLLKCQEGIRYILSENMLLLPVLTADTIVVLGEEIFGKPESKEDAIRMLMQLSGKIHSVITGVTIGIVESDQAQFHTISVESKVEFSILSEHECQKYCSTMEPFDKAGGYGIQGYGSTFVKNISGSYSNIVGLPMHEVTELFKKLNIAFWNKK